MAWIEKRPPQERLFVLQALLARRSQGPDADVRTRAEAVRACHEIEHAKSRGSYVDPALGGIMLAEFGEYFIRRRPRQRKPRGPVSDACQEVHPSSPRDDEAETGGGHLDRSTAGQGADGS